MMAAIHVPNWITALAAAAGSPHPSMTGTISRCAVELMGMNSVSPCTRPRTMASVMFILLYPAPQGELLHLPDHRQDQRPAAHGLAEVALQHGPHLLLQNVGVDQPRRGTFRKDACQHPADFVQHFLAG